MNKNAVSPLLQFYVRRTFMVVFGLLLWVADAVSIALIWGWGNVFRLVPKFHLGIRSRAKLHFAAVATRLSRRPEGVPRNDSVVRNISKEHRTC